MTDKELLRLAALAAGIAPPDFTHEDGTYVYKEPRKPNWNPLINDGDALRLAVNLKLHIINGPGGSDVSWWDENAPLIYGGKFNVWVNVDIGGDYYAATRRAIVQASARVGQAMKEKAMQSDKGEL